MSTETIYVRGRKAEVLNLLRQILHAARGNAASAMLTRMGMELLGRIRTAFVVKARGGTDEAGISWPPLKKSTIAYSRRHPGLPPAKVRAGKRPSYALTAEGRKQWWKDYGQQLAIHKGDQGHAAAVAWLMAKQAGERTLMELYGNTPVEILRDTGLLLNSITPGSGSPHQIFRIGEAEVTVGTNRKFAALHHRGVPGRLPKRPLWPSPRQWPQSWWTGILETAKQSLIDIITGLISRKSA